MTPEDALAARMYPNQDTNAPAPASPPPTDSAADLSPDGQAGAIQPLDRPSEAQRAEQMADAAALIPESPDAYTQALASGGFEQLQFQARYDKNEEAISAFTEGQRAAGELLHEHGVPVHEAKTLTRQLTAWHARDGLSDEQLTVSSERCMAALRKQWGRDFDTNLSHAKSAAASAVTKAPWLADLIAKGAGNDPELIKQFATIGRRQARRAKK